MQELCLNMIVKNEMANLQRCFVALAPHIACWIIVDTGSTDGTQDFIRGFFTERGIPGELQTAPFVNFEQARNAALDFAAVTPLAYDYLLLADADMELVVEDTAFRAKLTAQAYQVIQRSSGFSYWNTRLLRRSAGARYRGVTHEYIDIPGGGAQKLNGVWYVDHASGSNRVNKFERDIRLLRDALDAEPDNPRHWFYLAQSYRDAGRTVEAAETYVRRAGMGGWDEEAWYSRLQLARCLRALRDDGGFLREALTAFNQRPQRAEPLYDLARYYREMGMNEASLLFSEPGLAIVPPDVDILFIEEFVYTAGLREEFSISANYSRNRARKDRGYSICNQLALSRQVPELTRNQARYNLAFYVGAATALLPSLSMQPVNFVPPDGYHPMNPSIARWGDELWMIQRCVNYSLIDGRYKTPDDAPIQTRNFLLRLDAELNVCSSAEILPPAHRLPVFPHVLGFEDCRLFAWKDALWCSATVRELNRDGWCEQVLARLGDTDGGRCVLTDWRVLNLSSTPRHEKNWMPCVSGDVLNFIYSVDPVRFIDSEARTTTYGVPGFAAEHLRGGTQAVEFDGGWLAITHEVVSLGDGRRYYHRFIWFDESRMLRRVSRPFYFRQNGVEFAAGLAWHPGQRRLIASVGVGDRESWLATVSAGDIRGILEPVVPDEGAVEFAALDAAPRRNALLADGELAAFIGTQTNRALRGPDAVERARVVMEGAGLPLHPDVPKVWDTLIGVYHTIATTAPTDAVLDAGAGKESCFLPALQHLGYSDLTGINLLFGRPEVVNGTHYQYGDITGTAFPPGRFDFVACLSVIEHGVDSRQFLQEMARVLRHGGHLFVSFDYWPEAIETKGVMLFGAPFNIYSLDEVATLIEKATQAGFVVSGDPQLDCDQIMIENVGLKYTFANLLFRRV